MKKKILFVAACISGSTLFAQPVTPLSNDSLKTLNEVVISVTKFDQKQNETGKVVTLITNEQLQRGAGKTLSEVLNQQVGITINGANNTPGTNQTIYMRGSHAANTLILLDGVPVYDAAGETNQFDISNFSLYNIERIEIMKGAQSTLYGSDAVAGVINIITKKNGSKPFEMNAIITAGSYDTYKGSVALSGSKNQQSYYLSYSKIDSKGFSAAYDSTGKNNFDKDGFSQDVLHGSFTFKPLQKLEARLYGKYSVNKSDIDAGAFTDDKDYRYTYHNLQTGFYLNYVLAKSRIRFNYNYNFYDRDYIDDSTSVGGFAKFQKGEYQGRSHFAELYSNWDLHKNAQLLTGIDYRRNATNQNYFSISSFGPYKSLPLSEDSINTDQISAYASLNLKFKNGFSTELGSRWNYHNIYGNNFTYSFNPSYLINHFKIFANASSAYRVPSLYQLYSEFGNNKLKPETTISLEAGVQYSREVINARVVLFSRETKDVFVFYTNPVNFNSFYINEDRQKDNGVEGEITWRPSDKFNVAVNYTYVDGKIYTKDVSGKDTSINNLYRRPANTFNFSVGYNPSKKLFLSAHLKNVSKFYEAQYASAPVKMNGYFTIDAYAGYLINKKIKLFIDLLNITDKQYFDIRGFNSKRFNYTAGASINL